MRITFKEKLPNLINGTINKISTEAEHTVSDNGSTVDIMGKILVLREIKTDSRVTEIRDYFPIEINISKQKLIKKKGEVSLLLEGFRFDFEGNYTIFSGDLSLTNVDDDGEWEHQEQEFEFVLEETK